LIVDVGDLKDPLTQDKEALAWLQNHSRPCRFS